jgi:hypothetical protein
MMIDTKRIAKLHDNIVRCFANDAGASWDFVLVIFERKEDDNGIKSYLCELVFKHNGNAWARDSVIASIEGEDLLNDLARLMATDGKTWSTCQLEIDGSGRYRFTFGYESPKYLDAQLVAEPMPGYIPQELP